MATARVKLNHGGMAAMLKSDEIRAAITPHAERVLAAAKASAAVATGTYRDDLHLEHATTDRAVVRVVSSVPHGMVVEANTGNLSRALDAA